MRAHLIITLAIALTLCGCQPTPRQQALRQLQTAVAALKVSTQNATYQEFHAQRLAVETCLVAHQKELQGIDYAYLQKALGDTEIIWQQQLAGYYPATAVTGKLQYVDKLCATLLDALEHALR